MFGVSRASVPHGRMISALRGKGAIVPGPDSDVVTTGATAKDTTLYKYQTIITSDGVTGAGQQVNLPDGTYVGQRKLLTSEINASDTMVLSAAALAKLDVLASPDFLSTISSVTFSADNKNLLLEWTAGSKWKVIDYNCTIVATHIDTLQCGAAPVTATLAKHTTTLLSTTAGAELLIPDGDFIGQRKAFVADITASGTIVAGAAMVAKLSSLGLYGASGLTGYASNDVVGGLTFDADAERILLQWTGAKWDIIYASAGVVAIS